MRTALLPSAAVDTLRTDFCYEKGLSLLKLGRVDEARAIGEAMVKKGSAKLDDYVDFFDYEGNRYGCQKQVVEIQRVRKEVIDLHNESVALHNELMQKSLQSNIERRLGEDNQLKPATAAPIVIEK